MIEVVLGGGRQRLFEDMPSNISTVAGPVQCSQTLCRRIWRCRHRLSERRLRPQPAPASPTSAPVHRSFSEEGVKLDEVNARSAPSLVPPRICFFCSSVSLAM